MGNQGEEHNQGGNKDSMDEVPLERGHIKLEENVKKEDITMKMLQMWHERALCSRLQISLSGR